MKLELPPVEAAGVHVGATRPTRSPSAVCSVNRRSSAEPAADVTERLRALHRLDVSEGGCSFTAPDLLLALWCPVVPEGPEDDEGRYFSSLLVAAPGYDG